MRHIRKGGVRRRAPKACSDPDVAFDRGAHNRTIGNGACGRNGEGKLGVTQAQVIDEVDLVRWWLKTSVQVTERKIISKPTHNGAPKRASYCAASASCPAT
jgi:hypothetical protein